MELIMYIGIVLVNLVLVVGWMVVLLPGILFFVSPILIFGIGVGMVFNYYKKEFYFFDVSKNKAKLCFGIRYVILNRIGNVHYLNVFVGNGDTPWSHSQIPTSSFVGNRKLFERLNSKIFLTSQDDLVWCRLQLKGASHLRRKY